MSIFNMCMPIFVKNWYFSVFEKTKKCLAEKFLAPNFIFLHKIEKISDCHDSWIDFVSVGMHTWKFFFGKLPMKDEGEKKRASNCSMALFPDQVLNFDADTGIVQSSNRPRCLLCQALYWALAGCGPCAIFCHKVWGHVILRPVDHSRFITLYLTKQLKCYTVTQIRNVCSNRA
jgi:hypothetical protein